MGGNMQLSTKTLTTYSRTADSAALAQNGYSSVQRNGYWGHTGFDWAITKNDNLDAGISYNNFGNTNQGVVNQQQTTDYPAPADTGTLRNSNNYFRCWGEDWNATYKRKFGREGQEISLSYQGSSYASIVTYQQDQFHTLNNTEFTGGRGTNYINDNENYLTLDYTRPFSQDIQLNVGVKGTFSSISNNADQYALMLPGNTYVPDLSQTDNFRFSRSIYAAYASFTCKLSKDYDLRLGIRDEYTITSFPADTIATPAYNFITPSATISRKLANDQTIKISYSRRIQRPGFGQYNPFINAADPANLSTGNPALLPQKMHSLEFSYYKFTETGSSLLITLFYRYSGDDWQGYSTYFGFYQVGDSTYRNTTVNTTINAATEQMGGLNISGTWAATKKMEIRCNGSAFDKYIVSDLPGGAIINSFNYRINLNTTYKFTKDLAAEFYCGYNSARVEVQGKYPSFASYSFAIRQQLLKSKVSLAFTTTDPFNKYTNQTTYISAENFSSVSQRRYPYQVFGLSFSYKFGKIEFKEKKPEETNTDIPQQSNSGENN
jgi:outer membrane receptor protein involved in Fe transport